jgi:RNA polymerase sigma factor (sigma-70 family)
VRIPGHAARVKNLATDVSNSRAFRVYHVRVDDLVRRAAAGDGRAFAVLVQETTPSIRTVVRQYVRSPEDVNDLVQEVYLRALQRLSTLEDPERFRSWLYAIARNAGLDHVRQARRRPTSAMEDELNEPRDVDPGPDELAEVRELSDRVRSGAARLNPRDSTLLAMVTQLGFTPTDVAGALGMSHTAAKVAVHRARQRLRNAMLYEESTAEPPATAARCGQREALLDAGQLVDAAVHVRSCVDCGARATAPPARTPRAPRAVDGPASRAG